MSRTATHSGPTASARTDLSTWPLLGRFLRWRHARTTAQLVLLLVAGLVLYDGFFGPALAPKNFAGVLPWVHWRGLVVLALLLVGNLFCFACPFMLPRRLAQRLLRPRRSWPRWLPGKWVALVAIVLFFWAYEAFDLWASPFLTAWVAVSYFVAAFVIDGFFRGAAFCKHVCPIGQFNFVGSLLSPSEIRVRDERVCQRCRTKDCIRGRYDGSGRLLQRGCELGLFQQRKLGNLDCTFCLDCIQACPHDNVGVLLRLPLRREMDVDRNRSGIGRLSERPDWVALTVGLTALGFLNAFGMVSPVYRLLDWLGRILHVTSEPFLVALVFASGIATLAVAVILASFVSSRAAGAPSTRWVLTRFALTLAPLGFGLWSAHYLFHFLTGALTIVPLAQSFVLDLTGRAWLGEPAWRLASLLSVTSTSDVVLLVLALGFFGSIVWTMELGRRARFGFAALLPWLILHGALFLAGVWLLGQPMEMRGTLLG
ncbi:MAG: FesM [Thermomicrobium sp.]|nr:FesM [Thermomicrobium sp.]MDW8058634.1 FesM [Thermomicrobium sp.]